MWSSDGPQSASGSLSSSGFRVQGFQAQARYLELPTAPSDTGIPPEVFDYRLGNRSALDWVIDQYQLSTDKRSGITSDPNREDDPQYIVRLVGQVIRVSVETVAIVRALTSCCCRWPTSL